jgi:hypothetical protein
MPRVSVSRIAALAVIATLCLIGSCKDNPESPPKIDPSTTFQPLTDKAAVIHNLVLSYNNADLAEYQKLLHPDYLFYNQAADVAQGLPEYITRDADINTTKNMFLAAKGQYPDPSLKLDALTLEITPASWMQLDTVPGLPAPCIDCWATTREYLLNLVFTDGQLTLRANGLVQIIVVPVNESGTKLYKLYRVEDIHY